MPLIKSPSKEAFTGNIRREISVGRSQKQSVAIAYAVKREAEKKKKKLPTPH